MSMTTKQVQEQYAKLKQIDKFANGLGFKIYRIDCSFFINDEEHTLIDTTLNSPSEKYLEHLKLLR